MRLEYCVLISAFCFLTLLKSRSIAYPNPVLTYSKNGVAESQEDLVFPNEESLDFEQRFGHSKKVRRDTSSLVDTQANRRTSRQTKHQYTDPRGYEMQSDAKIVFPDSLHTKPEKPPTCPDATYCENVESYPKDLINQALQRNVSTKYLAGVEMLLDVERRIEVTDEVPVCLVKSSVIYPQWGISKNNERLYIVNHDDFKQGILIEKCSQENSSCMVISDGLPNGYKAECKQRYVYKQLVAVKDSSIVSDHFSFPVSCCCHVSLTGDPMARMGVNTVNQKSPVTPAKIRKNK